WMVPRTHGVGRQHSHRRIPEILSKAVWLTPVPADVTTKERLQTMRILVTGISGFAGGYLAEALLGQTGVEVYGTSRRAQWPAELSHLADRVTMRRCDLGDEPAIEAVLRDVQPQQIYHLAGYSNAGQSHREPEAAWAGNLSGTRCLYDAIQRWGGRPRI